MASEIPFEVDYFGGCPFCRRNDGCLNVHRDHWFVCHLHRVKWCVGSNLFSAWRHESKTTWTANAELLAGYVEVEPLIPRWCMKDIESILTGETGARDAQT